MRMLSHDVVIVTLAACLANIAACGGRSRSDAGIADGAASIHRTSNSKEREFVATEADFANFMQWERIDLGEIAIGGHPSGHRFAFVNRRIARGKSAFTPGSIVVHAVARHPDPLRWEVFAMAKRGGAYNRDRARGWEFFILHVDSANRGIIEARGTDPRTGHENEYVSGEGGCNGCHGTVDAREVDGMITQQLQPGG